MDKSYLIAVIIMLVLFVGAIVAVLIIDRVKHPEDRIKLVEKPEEKTEEQKQQEKEKYAEQKRIKEKQDAKARARKKAMKQSKKKNR